MGGTIGLGPRGYTFAKTIRESNVDSQKRRHEKAAMGCALTEKDAKNKKRDNHSPRENKEKVHLS